MITKVVRVTKAADCIGASRREIYRLLATGGLRAVKRGRSTLVLVDSIEEHLAGLPRATFTSRAA